MGKHSRGFKFPSNQVTIQLFSFYLSTCSLATIIFIEFALLEREKVNRTAVDYLKLLLSEPFCGWSCHNLQGDGSANHFVRRDNRVP